jgi:hypothetical protein
MRYSQSSCSGLFVCTAILCWDYHHLKYTFFNIKNCTSKIEEKYLINDFICSNCTRENFFEYNFRCYKQITRIKLINYCQYKHNENICQCFPSDQPILKSLVKPGKSYRNTNRVNNINKSALSFVYILISFILLLIIFGGIIGVIFYWIKFKSSQLYTLK